MIGWSRTNRAAGEEEIACQLVARAGVVAGRTSDVNAAYRSSVKTVS